jgi:hypothetical protein
MAPSEQRELIALYAVAPGGTHGGRLQIFDIAAKQKLVEKLIAMPLDFWCWLRPSPRGEAEELALALVTPTAVSHWRVAGPNVVPGVGAAMAPAIAMTRLVTGGAVVDYMCDGEWQLLVVAEGASSVAAQLEHAASKCVGLWRGLAGALLVDGRLLVGVPLDGGGVELRCVALENLHLPRRHEGQAALPPSAPLQHCLALPGPRSASPLRLVAIRQTDKDSSHSLVALFWPGRQALQLAKLPTRGRGWQLLLDTEVEALDGEHAWAEGTAMVGLTENTQRTASLLVLLSSPSSTGSVSSVCAFDFELQNF